MHLKFAYLDFLDERKFRNSTGISIQFYKVLLGGFIDSCHSINVVSEEEINSGFIKEYLKK